MKRYTFFHSMAMHIVVAATIAGTYGCASNSPNAKSTVESMSAFGNNTAKGKDSIDQAIRALETLVASPASDIKTNLDAYSKSVAALDNQANVVRGDAEKMKANGDAFFKEWEGSEKVTPERRAELSASYDRIKQDMAAVKDEFTPLMASMKDVESYLRLDPSVKAINGMAPLATKAKANAAGVKSRLDAILVRVNSVRGMLETTKTK